MQDWADRWLLGDGSLTGTADAHSAEALRVHELVGDRLARFALPVHSGAGPGPGGRRVGGHRAVLLSATGRPSSLPDDWAAIPGAVSCSLENRLFRDAYGDFGAAGVAVRAVHAQQPDGKQRVFAAAEELPFTLLSDMDSRLSAALRLPTFRAGQALRLEAGGAGAGPVRAVRHVQYPVTDIPAAVTTALREASALSG